MNVARLCANCGHVHGGRGYGLCYTMLSKTEVCPCLVAMPVLVAVPALPPIAPRRTSRRRRATTRQDTSDVTSRSLSRRAARAYANLSEEGRAIYHRAARRLDDTDLALHEYAAEVGLDPRLLWRARQDLAGDARRKWNAA